jgi:hypothetical protein
VECGRELVAALPPAHPAIHGESIHPGRIFVAPNDNHLTIQRDLVRAIMGTGRAPRG